MQNIKLKQIMLIVGSILIIVGVFLMTWMLATEDDRNVIIVQIDEGESKPFKFEALTMLPGDECEYSVKLVKGGTNKFDLKFDFEETGDGTLKNYARVKIIVRDNVVYDDLLVNTLENKNILFSVDFSEDKNTEFRIVYYLPIDVGNEAKNAEALFGLMLTASIE